MFAPFLWFKFLPLIKPPGLSGSGSGGFFQIETRADEMQHQIDWTALGVIVGIAVIIIGLISNGVITGHYVGGKLGGLTQSIKDLGETLKQEHQDSKEALTAVHERIDKVEDTQNEHGERIRAVEAKCKQIHG